MSYNPLPEDINNNVLTRLSQRDIFDQVISTTRDNQVTATFFSIGGIVDDFVDISAAGGATASMASGKATFQTGAGATSSIRAKTFTNILYTPGFEVYSIFTVTFTQPTSVNSSQFVGLWDETEGFYVGYNGTTFGSAVMTGGVQTFTDRSAWNSDLLDGSINSAFTRNGIPEAINLNNINLFRVRFGWLGVAPIFYEVISPDGNWVTFHKILQPNTSTNPSIQNPNLPITLRIEKDSADATNLVINCACWAAGTSAPHNLSVTNYEKARWTSTTLADTSVVADTTGAGNVSISVIIDGAISAGVITFEISPDGMNWFPLYTNSANGNYNNTLYNLSSGGITLQAPVAGYIQARVRLSSVIIGTGSATIEIRPSETAAVFSTQVYQPTGANLHTVVDNGNITVTTSATGNAPSSVVVGITSISVVSANALRKGLILTNTSNKTISLGLDGASAVLNTGITLSPNGVWVMDAYTFTTGEITAIASAASGNLAIQEMQ